MLMTAVGLLSVNTEPVNSHSVSSEQDNTESSLFADVLDEGVARTGKAQPKIADDMTSQNTSDSKSLAAARSLHVLTATATGAKSNGNTLMQGELKDAAPAVDVDNQSVKGSATVLSGAKSAASVAVEPPRKSESKASTTAVSKALMSVPAETLLDMPEHQVTAGSVQAPGQKSSTVMIDASQTEVSDRAATPAIDASVSTDLLLPAPGRKQATPDLKELGIADSKTPTGVPAKGKDDVGKTGKPSKPEKKDEEVAGATGNATGIQAQIQMMMAVPAIAASSGGQSNPPSGVADDAASAQPISALAITLGQSGRLVAAGGHSGKALAGAAKADTPDVKDATETAPGDPTSQKAASDAVKNAAHPFASGTATGTREQAEAAAVSPPYPDGSIAGAAAGVTAAAHALTSKPQLEVSASSAGAMQTGTSTGPGVPGGHVDAAPRTLMASPTALEVGVPNGTHGWLKIRAEMTSGGMVDASLSTSSSSGQEMLHRELPSLTTFLQNEHVAVNTVVVQPAATAGADFRGLAGGMNGDGRGQAQSGSQGGESRQETAGALLNHSESAKSYVSVPGIGGNDLLSPASYVGGGGWLSVRA
jgi:hypothetical protein